MSSTYRFAKGLAVAAIAALLTGCVSSNSGQPSAPAVGGLGHAPAGQFNAVPVTAQGEAGLASDQPISRKSTGASAMDSTLSPGGSAVKLKDRDDQERIARLWRERSAKGESADFALGPGDVIEISVPVIAELKDRTERVAGNGTISLPFVGTIPAAGLTEKQLKLEVSDRLSTIMYRPQVDLFVKQYRSRQVAVVGQVDKPGLYDLTGPNETLLDMLNDAGGINKEAAQRVLFIPAPENHNALRIAGSGAAPPSGQRMSAAPAQAQAEELQDVTLRGHPIEIGLSDLTRGGDPVAMTLPARPGDMLVVPGAGEVVVEGWVDKPGSYKITPGLTLAGAVGAAGGAMFAANGSEVTIMRDGSDGKKIFIAANLEKINAGQAPDIPVKEGDVVSVPYSAVKLLPYAAVSLIGRGLYLSAAAPVF